MPIAQTEGYFESPWYCFLEEPMLFLLAWKWNLWAKKSEAAKQSFLYWIESFPVSIVKRNAELGQFKTAVDYNIIKGDWQLI